MRSLKVLCIVCFGLILCSASQRLLSQDPSYKVFANSVVPLPESSTTTLGLQLNDSAKAKKLEVHFLLETRNLAELRGRIAKGDVISPEEMRSRYSGDPTRFNALVQWLKGQHFVITHTSSDLTSVYASASIATIEKSLGTDMVPVTYEGKTTIDATKPPRLPREIGESVVGIDGLQPFLQAVKHLERFGDATSQATQPVPRPAAITARAYKIADILRAYDATAIGLTGRGQTIAILIDTVPLTTDLQMFYSQNGLKFDAGRFTTINVQGPHALLPPREGEETLDTEWASGIAPEASVVIYASGSLQYEYLDLALERIYEDAQRNSTLRQVSISLGLGETFVSQDEMRGESTEFEKLAAIGISVFVSSGDAGSSPDLTGHHQGRVTQVEYEASDPSVIGVGGTSLGLDAGAGTVTAETGWSGSGGGISGFALFQRPSWQSPYPGQVSPLRLVPDVSAVADPNPGAFTILNGKESPVGGTSWSTPIWAGFCALINEARQRNAKSSVFLAPLLYQAQPKAFRDIIQGSNGIYHASPGWDPVTGLGVPDLKELVDELK